MLNSLRTSALAAVLFVGTMAPALAQSAPQVPELRGTAFDTPEVTVYSWGIIESDADGPQIQYSWAQLNRVLNKPAARPVAAQSAGITAGVPIDLRGTEFDRPDATVYSWGVLDSPADGPQIQYTWSEVNRRLAAAHGH